MFCRTTLLATLVLSTGAFGQIPTPAISGGPSISGTLHYGVRFSQTATMGTRSYNDSGEASSVSVDVGYHSIGERHPFELLYSGGGRWATQSGLNNSSFQNLQLTQGVVSRKWVLNLSDTVSYQPQAPTTGASGIPGLGDLSGLLRFGTIPTGTIPDQSILTSYAPRISNAVSSGLEYRLNGKNSLEGSGSFGLLRFLDGNGLDGTQESANLGLRRRIDARNTIGADYVYSRFGYDLSGFVITSNGVQATYKRQWSRRLKIDIGFGPQWRHSSDSRQSPDRTSVAGNAGIAYRRGFSTATLRYVRGLNGGSGVSQGGMTDSAQIALSRVLSRNWTLALTGSFARTDALQVNRVTTTKYGGTQVSRRCGRYTSAYLSYTIIAQSAPTASIGNVFNGLTHVLGFGFIFSPRETRLNGR